MQIASIITDTTAAPAPKAEPVAFVDTRLAATLIENFISALELEGYQGGPALSFARGLAENAISGWGYPLRPLSRDRRA